MIFLLLSVFISLVYTQTNLYACNPLSPTPTCPAESWCDPATSYCRLVECPLGDGCGGACSVGVYCAPKVTTNGSAQTCLCEAGCNSFANLQPCVIDADCYPCSGAQCGGNSFCNVGGGNVCDFTPFTCDWVQGALGTYCSLTGLPNCTGSPSFAPTAAPTTASPTAVPTTASPTAAPTTASPTTAPTTASPTNAPTSDPTASPTSAPTSAPTTASPTNAPTSAPTNVPTKAPTASPTSVPTSAPTTASPTNAPTSIPTKAPTSAPTVTPTGTPTSVPTKAPTAAPTGVPTKAPTAAPTAAPTNAPTPAPTSAPTPPTESPTVSNTTVPVTPAIIASASIFGGLAIIIIIVVIVINCKRVKSEYTSVTMDQRLSTRYNLGVTSIYNPVRV